ncbi:MAG: TonB-dependent receptor [Saprospiraceae bacterium]|nr:MAG: TonB-dependent receptor [Saprospiraceae bacterium]
MRNLYARLLTVSAFTVFSLLAFWQNAYSQGVTSANILGIVTDTKGEALIGANVLATHLPSGTVYGTATREDGRFNLPNVRIGGPYKIEVTYTGFETFTQEGANLSLGQNFRMDIKLNDASTVLGEVTVIGIKNEIMNSERTGAATNIKKEAINALPTLSRGLNDFVRLTPQSRSSNVAATTGSGTSFAGQDSRFNNLTVDGSIFNNSFGLASAPAGQTNSSPISLDAIDEIQVNVAPYDVRQGGFTGAGINAVTRSGTNQFEGSVFYNTRSESLAGDKAVGTAISKSNFSIKQTGFRLGGPIIKNKLFFFINGEIERRDDPATSFLAARPGLTGDNVTRVLASDLDQLKDFLKSKYNYDAGDYENYLLNTTSDKAMIKLDYNVNNSNRVSFRFNYLKSARDVLASQSGSFNGRRDNLFAMNFSNSNYVINNDIYSGIVEVNSIIGTKFSNNIQFGFTANRDYRSSGGGVFPLVDILEGGRNYTTFGYEPFTPNNELNTDTWQFQENFTMYSGAHTITAGLNLEYFKFDNTFTPTYYGQYVFNSLQDFYDQANGVSNVELRRYQLTYSALPGGALPTATTKVAQPGAYLQDEMSLMGDKLKIIAGLRVDVPIYGNTALENPAVTAMTFKDENGNAVKYNTGELPKTNPLFSPRIGFNIDAKGDRSLQIRGGTGLFSGRPAFVWISNQVGNNGILTGSLRVDNTTDYPFTPDVTAYIPENATTPSSFNIAVTDPDFKFMQLWRSNLAVDYQLPLGLVGTLEGIYSKNVNNVLYINANLEPATGKYSGSDGRITYPGLGLTSTAQNNANRVNDNITDAIVLKNTNKGYTYSLTAKLERQFEKGFYAMAAYNFSQSKDMMTAGSIAASSWRDNSTVRGNNLPDLAISDFDQKHRIIAALSYKLEYLKHASTTFSLFLQSSNYGRFSYRYNGDMNGDQLTSNDLMYVPNNASELLFEEYTLNNITYTVAQQQQAFQQFIDGDSYLSSRKGKYTERNGALLPWVTTIDFSVQQEFFVNVGNRKHTIQLRADFYNFGNLIKDSWGVGVIPSNSSPLQFIKVDAVTNQPIYHFSAVNDALPTTTTKDDISLNSVWQAQLGVRYIF